jgi:hypothetical protein
MAKTRDIAAQIQQRVQLDGRFGRSKRRPRRRRETQIDGGRVERVDGLGQCHAEGFLGIRALRDTDQPLSEVGADTPIAARVGIGQSVARDVAAEPQVVELAVLTQARLDVAQAFPVGQLRGNELTLMHRATPWQRQPQSLRPGGNRWSNRDQNRTAFFDVCSAT